MENLGREGANIEVRLTEFYEDLASGLTEHEARGVKTYEVESWIEASQQIIEQEYGSDSEEIQEFLTAMNAMRASARKSNGQKDIVNAYLYGMRKLVL